MELVRGMNRRVVVIKSPDRSLFDEAIFIVREDALHRGVTGDEIIREAQRVAHDYTSGVRRRPAVRLPVVLWAVLIVGGLAAAAAIVGII